MKKILSSLLICCTLVSGAQEKIAHKIYSYGKVENSISGKTIIQYLVNDAKGEVKIVDIFRDFDIDAISWNKLFLPNFKYANEEIVKTFKDNDIKTLITIRINDVATGGVAIFNSHANGPMTTTTGSGGKKVTNVNLSFEIYNVTDGLSKPVCVVNAEANNFWKGGQRNITTMIVNRVLKAMKDEKAF